MSASFLIDIPIKFDDTDHKNNSLGFRGPEPTSDEIVLFGGCSLTYATGVEAEQSWPYLIANGDNYLNVAIPGSGIDVQLLNLTWAINNYNVKKLYWYASDPHRQVVVRDDEIYVNLYVPGDMHLLNDNLKLRKNFIRSNTLMSETIWQKYFWNIYTFFSLCKQKNIEMFVTVWMGEYDYKLENLKREFNVKSIGNIKHDLDKGTDNLHPGPKCHKTFADYIKGRKI